MGNTAVNVSVIVWINASLRVNRLQVGTKSRV